MELETIEYWQGTTSLIFIIVIFFVGLHFFLKYFKFHEKNLAYAGISWIGISITFLPEAINLIMILFFNSHLSIEVYFLIVFGFLPFTLLAWLILITNLMYRNKQKLLLIIYVLIFGILEVVFFYLLYNEIEYIGNYLTSFNIRFGLFSQIYLLISIITFEIPGFLFAHRGLKSDDPEIKLKGRFLLLALILFAVAAVLEVVAPWTVVVVISVRILLILSSFAFYYGFVLPNFIKKLFLNVE